ncbi:hypothetical protein A1O3_05006 [Capronia epimyces CBS 606.96]|uniref:Uncharacterized protein n=1 Tax=Capronia epimyces CBS 606.96 TaxID=1182542 RepID=W9YQ26_9EURO|nr:uncharacterized protein A1O3_05006 [Capronia epimyces CBS 606.96]EXJ84339.1 hypothetical protein A1O3_05006 [Capronia epimyces CBS 606.96]
MVRLKHRYLLFNILYPTPTPTTTSTANFNTNTTDASYLLFARPSPTHLTAQLLLHTLRSTISQVFGEHGLGTTQAGLKVVYFSPSTSTCILRVTRPYFRLVWASLTYMDSIPGPSPHKGGSKGYKPNSNTDTKSNPNSNSNANSNTNTNDGVRCVVRVVRVSGTIRKSEEEVLRRARAQIVRAKREGRSVDSENDGVESSTSLLLDGLIGKSQTARASVSRAHTAATSTGSMAGAAQDEDEGIEDLDDEDYDLDDLSD